MPFLPKRLVFILLPAALCGCGNIEPQGPLKSVLGGGKGPERTPEEERRDLEAQREVHQQTPPANQEKGAVGFKIPL